MITYNYHNIFSHSISQSCFCMCFYYNYLVKAETQPHVDTHIFCVCVSCDDIVRPCSLRRSQERDPQMRSSWTSKMKYSSALIRGWTHSLNTPIFSKADTQQCVGAYTDTAHTHKHIYCIIIWPKVNISIYASLRLTCL